MNLTSILSVAVVVLSAAAPASTQEPERAQILKRTLERLRTGGIDQPLLRWQQARSLNMVFHVGQSAVNLPDETETELYRRLRQHTESEALDYLDELYGRRDDLKALALRDSDSNGVPDFRASDYYGKFMEGDIDVDGDGVRNLYDAYPFDGLRGGNDADGDGVPDTGFADENGNGLPDHIDWSLEGDTQRAAIQLGLFRDYKILLVDRNASFDIALARAADDTIRRVFRAYFEEHRTLPTLRTIATERTALLSAVLAAIEEDDTSAQVFSQTQSLIVYNPGRNTDVALGLLGLFVHEMGHSYHMSLDFDASDGLGENGRTDFPASSFVALVKPFGWTSSEYYDGDLGAGLDLVPRFVYMGTSEPVFLFREETPEAWETWIEDLYEGLNQNPDYLSQAEVVSFGIVSDYALSSPYEWYGDNFIAYVVSVLEDEALTRFGSDADAMVAARLRVDAALRSVWPGFYHRNLAPDVRAYFEATFPITASDRRLLANRYIDPILDDTFNVRASPARIVCAARQSSRFGVPAAPAASTQ